MSVSPLPKKVVAAANSQATTSCSQMIKNDQAFCCQTLDLNIPTEDGITMPDVPQTKSFMEDLFGKTLKFKAPNPKALENMKAKGITPKKQAAELLLAMIVASNEKVHIGFSVPMEFHSPDFDLVVFVKSAFSTTENLEIEVQNEGTLVFVDLTAEFPLKERDNVSRMIFEELKKKKIYQPEPDSDDEDQLTFDDL